jgi:hypothetical protein
VIRTLAATTVAVLLGAAAVAALYWSFLNTPESTLAALSLSALLAVAAVALAAITVNVLLLAWTEGQLSPRLIRRAVRQAAAGVLPLLFVAAVWWIVLRAEGWLQLHVGEISAWFIAQFGWADVTWLFRAAAWAGQWLRWVVAPFAALVWWRQILGGAWRPSRAALRDALHPLHVLTATAIVLALVWAPWTQVVPWRPQAIAPGTSELLFVGAKLAVVVVLGALASTLLARTASTARPASSRRGPTLV